jgi:hypothetical protein
MSDITLYHIDVPRDPVALYFIWRIFRHTLCSVHVLLFCVLCFDVTSTYAIVGFYAAFCVSPYAVLHTLFYLSFFVILTLHFIFASNTTFFILHFTLYFT